MSDEHDSWFSNTFGIDLGGAAKKIQDEARAVATQVTSTVSQAVQTVETKVTQVVQTVETAVGGAINTAAGAVKAAAASGGLGGGGLKAGGPTAAGGGTGKFPLSGSVGRGGQNGYGDVQAVQRALGLNADGQCGSGTIAAIENFQRSIGQASPDGRVDAGGGTERALAGGAKPAPKPAAGNSPGLLDRLGDMASDVGNAVTKGASTALDWGNTAGKAVLNAEGAVWDATKGAYTTVTDAYDSVAPNFTQANKDLGNLVDMAEAAAKKGNNAAAAQYGDIPILGSVVKASTAVNNAMIDATGGAVKGVGDLTAMAGNAVVHPIDATVSLAEGALGIAEHVPLVPGLNTTVKGIHGLVDLARGKEDGEYGSSLGELAENLAMGTHRDPNDPSKKSNADVDFLAGMGGGTKAWTEKPAEAATRTIVNILPMLLGDEGAGGAKPPPEGGLPVPEGGPPKGGPPVPEGGPPKGGPPGDPPSSGPPSEIPPTEPGEPPTLRTPPPEPFDPAPSFRDGPNTEVNPSKKPADPAKPVPEPEGGPPKDVDLGKKTVDLETEPPEVKIAVESLVKAEQNLADWRAIDQLAEDAHIEATQKEIRYRTEHHVGFKDGKPVFKNGKPVWDASYDPHHHAELQRQADLRGAEHDVSVARVKVAKKGVEAAEKAVRDAESAPKSKGGGLDQLFPKKK